MLYIHQILIDDEGKNVLNDHFECIEVMKSSYIIVRKEGYVGLYLKESLEKVLECEWDKFIFDGDYIIASKNNKVAVFDKFGRTILFCCWDRVILYKNGILVFKDGLQGFYNYEGECILDCSWKRIEPYNKKILAYKGDGSRALKFDY